MMNVFFICVFLKAASNLKENITLELCIEGMIRLVVLKCVDADGNAVDEDPVFHGIPDGRNGIGFPVHQIFSPAKWMPEVFCSGGLWDSYISLSH
ncbi:hypothetical protein [Mediterraneibacter sp.]|uniref:hypothetical protein n=1 Tax=Mediterraneibacter sp. TaxID=2316022 RepID=UPI0039950744